jgi:hypothetical protein
MIYTKPTALKILLNFNQVAKVTRRIIIETHEARGAIYFRGANESGNLRGN